MALLYGLGALGGVLKKLYTKRQSIKNSSCHILQIYILSQRRNSLHSSRKLEQTERASLTRIATVANSHIDDLSHEAVSTKGGV